MYRGVRLREIGPVAESALHRDGVEGEMHIERQPLGQFDPLVGKRKTPIV